MVSNEKKVGYPKIGISLRWNIPMVEYPYGGIPLWWNIPMEEYPLGIWSCCPLMGKAFTLFVPLREKTFGIYETELQYPEILIRYTITGGK